MEWVWRGQQKLWQVGTHEKHTGRGVDTPRKRQRQGEGSAWQGLAWFPGLDPDPPVFWMWASSLVTAAEALSPHRFSEKTRKE